MSNRPNCIRCKHYFVTHNPVQPYGCRGLGFKCVQNPAAMVFASSGIECQMFLEKKIQEQKRKNSNSGGTGGGLVA